MHRAVLLLTVAVTVSASGTAQRPALPDLVVTGADVVDVESGRIARHTVVVRNGAIESLLAPGAAAPESAATLDGSGKYLIPGARILAGTDTFDGFVLPGVSLHQELALLVEAGLTPLQVLQAATRNPAEFRGTANVEGSVAKGHRADLVLLDGNPLQNIRNAARIHAVVTAGRVHTRAALDRLLDGARTAAK